MINFRRCILQTFKIFQMKSVMMFLWMFLDNVSDARRRSGGLLTGNTFQVSVDPFHEVTKDLVG